MLADSYIHPLVMIIIVILSILRWVNSVFITKDPRGLSAILARMYLLYFYVMVLIEPIDDSQLRFLIFSLGLGAVMLDESVFWISSTIGDFLKTIIIGTKGLYKKIKYKKSSNGE